MGNEARWRTSVGVSYEGTMQLLLIIWYDLVSNYSIKQQTNLLTCHLSALISDVPYWVISVVIQKKRRLILCVATYWHRYSGPCTDVVI